MPSGYGQPVVRFWRNVDRSGACWLWTGACNDQGYGLLTVDYRQVRAHRFSYELHSGEIPDGMVVMHDCDNPPCVNPAHLRLGTVRDNNRDAAIKKRRPRFQGSKNPVAKLTEAQVRDMRARYALGGITQRQLANEFGVSVALVSYIVNEVGWRHI